MNPEHLRELSKQLASMISQGIVEPSTSQWASPILFVEKKNGELRLCVDYRSLNDATIKSAYPLPRIDECLDQLQGANVFSALDLESGYHQIPMAEDSRELTAFTSRYGHFQYRVMPFGLCNAPSTFQSWMNNILRPYLDSFVVVYLDDILIYSKDEDDHRRHLELVMEALATHSARLNVTKCAFFKREIRFLGHVIDHQGIRPDPGQVEKIAGFAPPRNKRDVQSFLGTVNFFRRFIRGCATIATPLYALTRDKVPFVWTDGHQAAFEELKRLLTSSPVLCLPDTSRPFTVHTDASDYAIGAVLLQEHDGYPHPVAYYSRSLKGAEHNYPVFDKELLSVREALEQWSHYLQSRTDTVLCTDHKPLTTLSASTKKKHKRFTWWETIQQYNVRLEYLPGATNVIADMLSRPP